MTGRNQTGEDRSTAWGPDASRSKRSATDLSLELTVAVIAKEPLPGRVKTRLTPPCTPEQASRIAEASLSDTLKVIRLVPARRRVCVLDGATGPWLPQGVDVVAQCDGELGARLAQAFVDLGGPTLILGMDTPQLTIELLASTVSAWSDSGTDAVLGRATDGGYWCIGLRRPEPSVTAGVPMSRSDTCDTQLRRLATLGMSVMLAEELDDFDTFTDATKIAAAMRHHESCPPGMATGRRFVHAMAEVQAELTNRFVGETEESA